MSKYEISSDQLQKDVRPLGIRVQEWFLDLNHVRAIMIIRIVLMLALPGFWIIWVFESVLWAGFVAEKKLKMPMRVPKDIGGTDPSDYFKVNKRFDFLNLGLFRGTKTHITNLKAGGILYWGSLRTEIPSLQGMEIWSTNSDGRTHAFLAGTTGSGKSESLYGLVYNSLCWGSGAIYADGKADISLPFTIWSLCRRLGREDDFLHLNLLTAGRDPYEDMLKEEQAKNTGIEFFASKEGVSRSNTLNPFYSGTADFQLQLLASLLPKTDGSGAQWQEKAINLVDAIIRCLRYKHLRADLTSGIETIRQYMALEELVKLYKEGEAGLLPEAAYSPIAVYLKTGLSLNFALIDEPEKWDQEIRNQHSYLTSQFGRTLAMMMESYGFVYKVKHPEIDMTDVLLNNRILVVSIPSMEKSPQEAEALGKLVISCIKLMMAESLGANYEGTIAEILESRPTASAWPTLIITDELAYYYAQGLAVMYAQARSLGFMMIAAVQDIQGLKRGSAGDETASLLANTKFKYCLALEDTADTYDLIRQAAGEAYYSTLSGYDYNAGMTSGAWKASDSSRVEKSSRLDIQDVKKLNAGEGYLIFKDALVELSAFYIPDEEKRTKLKPRVNRFIETEPPKSLDGVKTKPVKKTTAVEKHIPLVERLLSAKSPIILLDDPINTALLNASDEIFFACSNTDMTNEDAVYGAGLDDRQQKLKLFNQTAAALSHARNLGDHTYKLHSITPEPITQSHIN